MSEKINFTANIQVAGGPRMAISQLLEVDAYDKLEVTIPSGGSKAVEIQPGNGDKVKLLAITSTKYGAALTYKVNENTDTVPAFALDQPHVLTGSGAVGMLDSAPQRLFFKNGFTGADAVDVTVQILVGRAATITAS